MKTLFKKLETMFAASAFAEAGEHETALQLLKEQSDLRKTTRPSVQDRQSVRPTMRAN